MNFGRRVWGEGIRCSKGCSFLFLFFFFFAPHSLPHTPPSFLKLKRNWEKVMSAKDKYFPGVELLTERVTRSGSTDHAVWTHVLARNLSGPLFVGIPLAKLAVFFLLCPFVRSKRALISLPPFPPKRPKKIKFNNKKVYILLISSQRLSYFLALFITYAFQNINIIILNIYPSLVL
jgi:hypothetical protein